MKRVVFDLFSRVLLVGCALLVGCVLLSGCGGCSSADGDSDGDDYAVRRAKVMKYYLNQTEADKPGNSIVVKVGDKKVVLFRGMKYEDVEELLGQPDKGGSHLTANDIRSLDYLGGKVTLIFSLDILSDFVVWDRDAVGYFR